MKVTLSFNGAASKDASNYQVVALSSHCDALFVKKGDEC